MASRKKTRVCPGCGVAAETYCIKCGRLAECVVCGEFATIDTHHCDPAKEKKIEDSRSSYTDEGRERTPGFSERLSDGFRATRRNN